MRRGFGFVGLLGVLLIAGIAGAIGYNIGLSTGLNSAGAATAVVVAPWGLGFGPFGFLFGILFLFLFIGLIGRLLFGGRRHGHGYGPAGSGGPGGPGNAGWGGGWSAGSGPRGWDGRTMPPFVEPMLRDWHSQAHAGPASTTGAPGAAPAGGASGPSGPSVPGSGPNPTGTA